MLYCACVCLVKASSAGYQSLAFPALGTGKLEYPDIDVVKLMFRAVSIFLQENPSASLQDIYFIVYPGASQELKQYFLVYSVTQKVSSEQLNNTATLHAKLRASHSDRFEVMFRVGKTLVKVVNADVNKACHPACPVLILWSPEEIQDPSLNNSVTCVCTRPSNNDQFQLVDRLSDRPISTCEAVLKAVKKCSSSVCAIVVVIPDAKVFVPFISKAAKMYKPVEAAELDTKTLVEKTWFDSFVEWSRFKSVETLKKGDYSVLTVTSDSEKTNKRVAMEFIGQCVCVLTLDVSLDTHSLGSIPNLEIFPIDKIDRTHLDPVVQCDLSLTMSEVVCSFGSRGS